MWNQTQNTIRKVWTWKRGNQKHIQHCGQIKKDNKTNKDQQYKERYQDWSSFKDRGWIMGFWMV